MYRSTGARFRHDRAAGNGDAGLSVRQSPDAYTSVIGNIATGNEVGINVENSRHVAVIGNDLTGNCQGISVLDLGGAGGAGNVIIWENRASRNNRSCPAHGVVPELGGTGVVLYGVTHSVVEDNDVYGNTGALAGSGGIVVDSITAGGTHHPAADVVTGNRAWRNRPGDLVWDSSGTDILFLRNSCGLSLPAGMCR